MLLNQCTCPSDPSNTTIFREDTLTLPMKYISCFRLKTASKKYVDINGKVSKDKWQSMFRYLAKYVKTLFSGFVSGHFRPVSKELNEILFFIKGNRV